MKPAIGRIVHYVNDALIHCPAIVVSVNPKFPNRPTLFVIEDNGRSSPGEIISFVDLNEAGDKPRTWHAPERVE